MTQISGSPRPPLSGGDQSFDDRTELSGGQADAIVGETYAHHVEYRRPRRAVHQCDRPSIAVATGASSARPRPIRQTQYRSAAESKYTICRLCVPRAISYGTDCQNINYYRFEGRYLAAKSNMVAGCHSDSHCGNDDIRNRPSRNTSP
jgi:hypothetical protein